MRVIKVSASWCCQCKALKPVWDKVASDPKYGNVTFEELSMDNDEDTGIATNTFGVRNLPTIIIVNGDDVRKDSTIRTEDALRKFIEV